MRTYDEIQRLVESDPFKTTKVTPKTVPQVTFLKQTVAGDLKSHYPVFGKGYSILGVYDHTVCSVVDLTGATTPDLMRLLDQTFGKTITTRNWKTVKKVVG